MTTTRAAYMSGKMTHEEYYRAINRTAGYRFRASVDVPLFAIREALAAGDEHLNTIPLALWDRIHGASFAAYRAHGDVQSMAGNVCSVKQAAKDYVRGEQ